MGKLKVCVDIGGTKTIFAVINEKLEITKSFYLETPKTLKAFKIFLNENLKGLKSYSNIVNVSVAGRISESGKMLFCPNLPIKNFDLNSALKKYFKSVNIDNDGNCFAIYELFAGHLKNRENGVLIVWGTGIGGALVIDRKIYRGLGLASELGHIKVLTQPKTDLEDLLGGRWLKTRFSYSGLELNALAKNGNRRALKTFAEIGRIFGRYLSSLAYLFDPETVVIGGSFSKSWNYMKKTVEETIRDETLRRKMDIKLEVGDFYVIKGCYFLDDYAKLHNKL